MLLDQLLTNNSFLGIDYPELFQLANSINYLLSDLIKYQKIITQDIFLEIIETIVHIVNTVDNEILSMICNTR